MAASIKTPGSADPDPITGFCCTRPDGRAALIKTLYNRAALIKTLYDRAALIQNLRQGCANQEPGLRCADQDPGLR
jgi:hypothetical protein